MKDLIVISNNWEPFLTEDILLHKDICCAIIVLEKLTLVCNSQEVNEDSIRSESPKHYCLCRQ